LLASQRVRCGGPKGALRPCCGQDLADATEEPDSASDARPGDRWCPNCRWLIIREIDDALDWPVDCPTHGPLSD
jgi:hypothetical protein